MLHARWQIDGRFGRKQDVIERLQAWARDIAPLVRLRDGHLLTGSIGALEATLEHAQLIVSLADLEQAWPKLATPETHRQ
jgi:hypothetical protein